MGTYEKLTDRLVLNTDVREKYYIVLKEKDCYKQTTIIKHYPGYSFLSTSVGYSSCAC